MPSTKTYLQSARRRLGPKVAPVWILVGRWQTALLAQPVWIVLGSLLVLQWLVIVVVALGSAHNGFLFYGGGDETWYYTTAWVLGHGHVPQSYIGYGYSFLIAPLTWIAGPNILNGMSLVVVFNALVLWPIALLCIYGIAKAIGGRGFAFAVSFLWTVFPLLATPYFDARYHYRFVNIGLATALGLTPLGDFPSMIFVLIASYFTLKAIAQRSAPDAILAGLAAGFVLAVKPSNMIFLPAPLAAFLIARRGHELLLFGASVVPALAGLALWKYRGLGDIPAFHTASATLASGSLPAVPIGGLNIHRYFHINWGAINTNLDQIREHAWSLRLLTWIPIAGLIGLWRRSAVGAAFVGVWFAGYFVLRGSLDGSVGSGSFFKYMVPAFPAYFLLAASIPVLVPIFGRNLVAAGRAAGWPAGERRYRWFFGVAGVLTVVPLVSLVLMNPLVKPAAVRFANVDQYVPANAFALSSKPEGSREVLLSWPSQQASSTHVSYVVFRAAQDPVACALLVHAAANCDFFTDRFEQAVIPTAQTVRTSWLDEPGAGHWVYRVALRASPSQHAYFGDYLMLSRPVAVEVAK